MKHSRSWRHVATLLLLFAAADVLVPGLCLADAEQPPAVSSWAPSASVSGNELDGQHDDCFCCCAHVIAESRHSVFAHQSAVEDVAYVLAVHTEPSPAPLYRPPRAL